MSTPILEKCFTLGALLTEDSDLQASLATRVEHVIDAHYCLSFRKPCLPFDPTNKGGDPDKQRDFFDEDAGVTRCDHLAEYLGLHWTVDQSDISRRCTETKLPGSGLQRFPVPDILTTLAGAPPGENPDEFYEIKPDSPTGRRDARSKIKWFGEVNKIYKLDYAPGTKYGPDVKLLLWRGQWYGDLRNVHLHWRLREPGMLVYDFCVSVRVDELAFALMIVAGIVATLVLKGAADRQGFPWPAGAGTVTASTLGGIPSTLSTGFGPPDAPPSDPGDFAYVLHLVGHRQERLGRPGAPFGPVVPGTDEPTTFDDGPWAWDSQTMAAIADVAPDGRFTPGGDAIHALELDHMMWLLGQFALDDPAVAPLFGDGDDPDIDVVAASAQAVGTYLQRFKDEALYYITHDGQWA